MKKLTLTISIVLFVLLGKTELIAQTVYITKSGEKYHAESCHYLSNSKIEIEISKAINSRYQPCKVCKPAKTTGKSLKQFARKKTSPSATKRNVAVRCSGKTKSGTRCKRKTKNASGRCYQH